MSEPLKICSYGGCNIIVRDGQSRCLTHRKQRTTKPDNRPSRSQRGYTRRWYDDFQRPYLASHPLCEECEAIGIVKAAECVDHKTPHKGNPALLYCWENLRALCWSCHSRKTAREQRKSR